MSTASNIIAEPLAPHQHTCPECGATHESLFRGQCAVCPACLEQRQQSLRAAERHRHDQHAQAARLAAWEALCPPDYRSTAWRSHPELSPLCYHVARHWGLLSAQRRPEFGTERGLLLYGPTGRGKTRCMFAILRRLHFSGVPCHFVEAVRYADHAVTAADIRAPWTSRRESTQFLDRAKHARVLCFDDLGKEGTTPGFARAFHDLLEHRKSHHLPTLITSERVGSELAQTLGTNYADGIVRRIRETCAIFHTEEAPPESPPPESSNNPADTA